MHQRKRNNSSSRHALSLPPKSAGKRQAEIDLADWMASQRSEQPLEDWELESWDPQDPPILFDSMDFEGKRVDLPCDEEGQVFLAPLRRFEPASGDDLIRPPLGGTKVAARSAPADQVLTGEPKAFSSDLSAPKSEEGEGSNAVKLDLRPLLPRADALAEAPMSAEALEIPALQSMKTVQDRWAGDPRRAPSCNNDIDFGSAAPGQPVANPNSPDQPVSRPRPPDTRRSALGMPAMAAMSFLVGSGRMASKSVAGLFTIMALCLARSSQAFSVATSWGAEAANAVYRQAHGLIRILAQRFYAASISLLRHLGRGTRASVAIVAVVIPAFWAKTAQLLRVFKSTAAVIGHRMIAWAMAASKMTFSLGVRFTRTLASVLHVAAGSLFVASRRMIRSLAARIVTGGAISWTVVHRAMMAFVRCLPSFGKANANLMRAFSSTLSSALGIAAKAPMSSVINVGSAFRRRLFDARMASSGRSSQTHSEASILDDAGWNRSKTTNRKAHQFLNNKSGRARASLQRMTGRGVSLAAKGKPRAMETVQQALTTARSVSGAMTRAHLAGLAGGCACIFLLIMAWSGAPMPQQPSVTMPLPPKPAAIAAAPSQNEPIVFDWPSLKNLRNKPEPRLASQAASVERGAPASKVVLSPEDALARLIKAVAPRAASGPLNESPTPAFRTEGPSAGLAPRGDIRLAALTLLADIETIAGLGEFANAARTVGLDTLIHPNRTYTMLVPSDAAFAKLGQDKLQSLLDPSGHDQLRALLSHHILEERLLFNDFAGEIRSYLSLADQTITIAAKDVIRVDQASMIETDLRAANTVIHVIDEILELREPQDSGSLPSVATTRQASDT